MLVISRIVMHFSLCLGVYALLLDVGVLHASSNPRSCISPLLGLVSALAIAPAWWCVKDCAILVVLQALFGGIKIRTMVTTALAHTAPMLATYNCVRQRLRFDGALNAWTCKLVYIHRVWLWTCMPTIFNTEYPTQNTHHIIACAQHDAQDYSSHLQLLSSPWYLLILYIIVYSNHPSLPAKKVSTNTSTTTGDRSLPSSFLQRGNYRPALSPFASTISTYTERVVIL